MRFFRRLLCLMSVVALLVSALPTATGESYPFIGYTTDSLRLRASASTKSTILMEMPKGSALYVTGETGDFYIVQYEGVHGYAMKSYISKSSTLPAAPVKPTATPNPAASAYAMQYSGMSGSAVRAIQEALKELGFYKGVIDGKFGSGTVSAVTSFQLRNGLNANGVADVDTQYLLFEGKPKNSAGRAVSVDTLPPIEGVTARRGDAGELVERIQSRLFELGYYTSAIDGKYGSGTESAVKRFQRAKGLNADGEAGIVTQRTLFAAVVPTPTPSPTAFKPAPVVTATIAPTKSYPYNTNTLVSVNMRKGRSVSAAYIQTVPKGALITVQSMEGDYIYAVYNGKSGYLNIAYVNIPAQYLGGSSLSADADAQHDYDAIYQGATGANVKALQQALNELGFYTAVADGVCGENTVTAIKKMQRANALIQDGVASPEIQQLIFEKGALSASGKRVNVKTVPDVDGFSMSLNDKGDRVTALQNMLATLGYYKLAATGEFDRATYQAVRDFQKAKGLYVDGVAGPKTLSVLYILSATPTPTPMIYLTPTPVVSPTPLTAANVIVMQLGTRGVAVKSLQERLIELGYYACIPDGIYDSDDIAAVRQFQQKNGLKADGIAGLETQLRLYSQFAVPYVTAAPTITVTPTPMAMPEITEILRMGSKGESVKAMQSRLITLGYLAGAPDGIFGAGTANAVMRFQRANALTADGIAGKDTLTKLYSVEAIPTASATASATPTPTMTVNTILRIGDRNADVKAMQQKLVALGYLTLADGVFGLNTYNAVKSFQSRNGLTADGIAGSMTLTKLSSSSAIGASTVNPTVKPGGSSSFAAPKAAEVRYANWFSEIRSRARSLPDVIIYDPLSGLHYNLHMFSFGKHADAEPPTAADTEIMYQMIGENEWTPKAVWVIFSDGRVYMASTHSHGHEVDHTSGNNLTGHVCLHFPRIMSEAEETGPYAVSHQKAILLGWEMTQAMIGR